MTRIVFGFVALALAAFATPAAAGDLSGQFSVIDGKEKYTTVGGVTIKKSGGKTLVVLSDDFKFPGAPDPQLGFGSNGSYDKATTFVKLTKLEGSQTFEVPSNINLSNYNEFYVWCERYSVPLSLAKLK